MKLFVRTVVFHFICIAIFAVIYVQLGDSFQIKEGGNKNLGFIDYLLLSTTIQAGVGLSDIYPVTLFSKLMFILQQVIMLCTHVFTVYIFTV